MSGKKILVELTLGHRASIRDKKTAEGYTHDWEVYVRSDQGQIQTFVSQVIFNLHDSFPKPRRVVREPPFMVKESGYAGFVVKIEVLFKNKEEPKKADFGYDLYLQLDGPPIASSRKEKLIFNYPCEDFAKKLFNGGGVIHKEKESRSDLSLTASSSAYVSSHASSSGGGGKSGKHNPSTNPAKASPKNSFENLFGTPIKRGSPSITTSTVSASNSLTGPSKDSKHAHSGGSGAKSGKTEKIFGWSNSTSGIGSGPNEKMTSKSSGGDKHSRKSASKSPMVESPTGSEVSHKPSSSKSSKSSHARNSSSERNKNEEKVKRMLPPEHSTVPKKSRKSELFEPSASSTTISDKSSKKHDKSKKSKFKIDEDDEQDSYPSPPEVMIKPDTGIKKEKLSPVSSSDSSSSSTDTSDSGSDQNSDRDESGGESEPEEMIERSNKRIAAANSTSSSTSRRRLSKRSESESGSDREMDLANNHRSPASSPASSTSCSSSGVPSPAKHRNTTSSSSSSLTPDHVRSQSPMEKPISSSSVKIKKEKRHRRDDKKSKKSKKSKRQKEKVIEDEPLSSDSSLSSPESYASPTSANPGITSNTNGLSPGPFYNSNTPTSSSIIGGTITPQMRILQDLHTRISSIAEPEKLQEVVDIVVETCGQDLWTMESGFTFDFDLCKLSSYTIRRIQDAILE